MKNKKLAIAIPTYNRSSILKENILLMLEEIKRYEIPVYISDDSTNDDTKFVFDEFKKEYEYIYYFKNQPSLGHDKNCLQSLSLPTEDYIWYLGDSIIIKPGGIKKVLGVIIENNKYDFICVNAENRNVDFDSKIYTEGNKLLVEIGWHLTLTGATIYTNKIHELIKGFDLIKCKNFPQTALIFEYFTKVNSKIYWVKDEIIYVNKNKKSYWNKSIFDVFLIDWEFFIFNLPNFYLKENKKYVVKKHSEKTGLFSFKGFLSYRSKGIYSYEVLRVYYRQIRFNSKVDIVSLLIISIVPISMLKFLRRIFYNVR